MTSQRFDRPELNEAWRQRISIEKQAVRRRYVLTQQQKEQQEKLQQDTENQEKSVLARDSGPHIQFASRPLTASSRGSSRSSQRSDMANNTNHRTAVLDSLEAELKSEVELNRRMAEELRDMREKLR
eukprot:PhF_6_TR9451/c0_g1_i2/m.14770